VSFEVKRGEVLGIIGRNGAGKTTLLKILSRITEPTEGRVRIKGRVASLLEVGTGFHPELTGRENIYLNGAILGMSKAEIKKKFDEIVAFAETEKFLDTPVKRYSSGMYVRLAFAVAAHLEPEILVVDEVLAVGDAEFQKKCLGKMESVAKREGRTVLFVSHNMAAVHRLCDSAILLHEGNLSDIGSVKDVIEHYLTSFTGTSDGEAIEPRQHVVNTGEVWIDRVTLTRETGEPASDIQLAEPLNILIRFEVRLPVRQLRFGIGLNTPDGVRVATLHHTDDEHEPISLAPGFYEMSLSITNPLSPGAYIISVGAHRALGGQTVEYIPEALRFNVLDVGQDRLVHHNYNAGLVRVAARWQVPDRV
jgi:lipopolysaccharide transport system ATP-binding protein